MISLPGAGCELIVLPSVPPTPSPPIVKLKHTSPGVDSDGEDGQVVWDEVAAFRTRDPGLL